jgi:hypothetical protein
MCRRTRRVSSLAAVGQQLLLQLPAVVPLMLLG